MKASDELREFARIAVSALCDHPEDVKIDFLHLSDTMVCLKAQCSDSDRPMVIGSRGRNANAIRQLLHGIASKRKVTTDLIIVE